MSNLDYYPHKEQILQLEENFKPLSRRSWGRDIKNLYQTRCLISGEVITNSNLVSHHIFSYFYKAQTVKNSSAIIPMLFLYFF